MEHTPCAYDFISRRIRRSATLPIVGTSIFKAIGHWIFVRQLQSAMRCIYSISQAYPRNAHVIAEPDQANRQRDRAVGLAIPC